MFLNSKFQPQAYHASNIWHRPLFLAKIIFLELMHYSTHFLYKKLHLLLKTGAMPFATTKDYQK